jgi:hypothetical protein
MSEPRFEPQTFKIRNRSVTHSTDRFGTEVWRARFIKGIEKLFLGFRCHDGEHVDRGFLHFPALWPGVKNSPTVTHACRKRRLKLVPGAWGYSWVTLSQGVINTETWFSRLGGWALDQQSSPVKRLLLRNPKRGGYGPYWAVEPYDDGVLHYPVWYYYQGFGATDRLDQGSPTFFGCGHLEGHFNSKRAECKKI